MSNSFRFILNLIIKKITKIKNIRVKNKKVENLIFNLFLLLLLKENLERLSSDLSDLRESEEAKLEKILGQHHHTPIKSPRKPPGQVSMNLTDRSSLGDVLKEVLDDLDVQSGSDLDDDSIKLDELLKRSSSPRKKPVSKSGNRGESTRRSADKPSDMTLDTTMKQRKVSPIVKREKEMYMRREAMKEKFAEKRQEAAKKLLREMQSDELILPTGKFVFSDLIYVNNFN